MQIANYTLHDICNVDFLPANKDQINWDPLEVEGDMTAEHEHIKPGHNREAGLQKGSYTVEVENCEKTYVGRTNIEIKGPTALAINTHEGPGAPPPAGFAGASVVMTFIRRGGGGPAQPEQGGQQRPCLPGGDMSTGIASECCTGVILISAQRPNMPSHCAYPDEVQ